MPHESHTDPRIDVIARAIYTGILYGGNDAEWDNMPDRESGRWSMGMGSKDWFRAGAQDVLRALDGNGS